MAEENNTDVGSYSNPNLHDVVQDSPETLIMPQGSSQEQAMSPTSEPTSIPSSSQPNVVNDNKVIMPLPVNQQASTIEEVIIPGTVSVSPTPIQLVNDVSNDKPSVEQPQRPLDYIPPSTIPTQPIEANPLPPKSRKKFNLKKIGLICCLVLFFVATLSGAYLIGKRHERIVFQLPPQKPINLPPQTVVFANCTPGRGKQYILPKDIPLGPIYDVVNSKVIAIEYNLNLADIQTNPDSLSNTILKLARDYPVDHFSIVPVATKAGETLANIHLIMFVVTKDEANSIKCDAGQSP